MGKKKLDPFKISSDCKLNIKILTLPGPSRDAQTKDVIWRHKVLDDDGIVGPGMFKKLHQALSPFRNRYAFLLRT